MILVNVYPIHPFKTQSIYVRDAERSHQVMVVICVCVLAMGVEPSIVLHSRCRGVVLMLSFKSYKVLRILQSILAATSDITGT